MPYFVPGCEFEQDRDQHDGVAEQNREERLRPVHAGRHQPRRQHVGRDAVRHADPERGVVVGGPVAPRERDRREVVVVERARLDASRVDELDAAVRRAPFVLVSPCDVLAGLILPAPWPTRRFPTTVARRRCLDALDKANARVAERFPGELAARQPVHIVYGGAHLFKADAARSSARSRCARWQEYAPDAGRRSPTALGLDAGLADRIYPRVVDKLTREPVEDFRIDFEDGFGNRPDEEEDRFARSTAARRSRGRPRRRHAAAGIGIRIKPLSEELKRRSLRTLRSVPDRAARRAPAARCRRTSSSRCRRSRRRSRWRRWRPRATRSSTGARARRRHRCGSS